MQVYTFWRNLIIGPKNEYLQLLTQTSRNVKVGLDDHQTTSVLSIGMPDAGIDATPHSLAKAGEPCILTIWEGFPL